MIARFSICSAHEYTESNARFAISVEPGNRALVDRVKVIKELRAKGQPTVPGSLGVEKATNPFLRGDISEEIRKNVGALDTDPPDVIFGKIRRAKDTFRG